MLKSRFRTAVNAHGDAVAVTTIKGERPAFVVAVALVSESCWFEVDPLPNDEWEFTVKRDRAGSLMNAVHDAEE